MSYVICLVSIPRASSDPPLPPTLHRLSFAAHIAGLQERRGGQGQTMKGFFRGAFRLEAKGWWREGWGEGPGEGEKNANTRFWFVLPYDPVCGDQGKPNQKDRKRKNQTT